MWFDVCLVTYCEDAIANSAIRFAIAGAMEGEILMCPTRSNGKLGDQ